jgi:hypothetical protein
LKENSNSNTPVDGFDCIWTFESVGIPIRILEHSFKNSVGVFFSDQKFDQKSTIFNLQIVSCSFLFTVISERSYLDAIKNEEKTDEIGRTFEYSIQDIANLAYSRIIEYLPQAIVFYALYGLWVLIVALISWIFNFQPQDTLDNIILYVWNQISDAFNN